MPIRSCPNVSILGDSISTLGGYTPESDVFYDPNFSRSTGVKSADDTWWMKVIQGIGGKLLINNSYAGSTVCRNGYQPASAPWRIAKLRNQDISPDYILIFSGLNDVALYWPPEEFKEHYDDMLHHLKQAYPSTSICCATLCRGFVKNPDWPLFINWNHCHPLALYNQSIREAVWEANCHLADLSSFQKEYSSIDGVHPDSDGMELLAQMWLHCIKNCSITAK